jgi:hypothetical protein
MDNSKYGKFIVSDLKPNLVEAPWTNPVKENRRKGRILWLDSEVIPGAFYVETVWATPRKAEASPKSVAQPHKHDFDEVLGMFGGNPADPYDLGGEVEFWLGDEQHIITRSCLIFIPAGLLHCPLIYRRVDRPMFNFTTHAGKMYV